MKKILKFSIRPSKSLTSKEKYRIFNIKRCKGCKLLLGFLILTLKDSKKLFKKIGRKKRRKRETEPILEILILFIELLNLPKTEIKA